MDGLVLIDKPAGMTSFGVVSRVRRRLSQRAGKKIKVGHTGTLDPFATGLMIVVVGAACKRAGEFSKLDKVYEATIRLGATSSTGDPEGEIISVPSAPVPSQVMIASVISAFTGSIRQTPPIFSAIKINGQRAYKLARARQQVIMPTRQVTVYSMELLSYDYPYLMVRTHVSSGTYIRSLASDMGKALGTGAYLTALRRTRVGAFSIDQALVLDEMTPPEAITVMPLPSAKS